MSELIFNPENHQYSYCGAVLPSVTQVMAPLYDFSMIAPDVLANKARFGKQIHKMIALFLAGELDEDFLSEIQAQYLEQFKQFQRDCPIDYDKAISEKPLCSVSKKYAGTPDIFIVDRFVIDIKTRPFNKVTDPIQLAAYDMLITENYAKPGVCRDLWVLELSADEYNFQRALPSRDKKEYQNRFKFLLAQHKGQEVFNKTILAWKGKHHE